MHPLQVIKEKSDEATLARIAHSAVCETWSIGGEATCHCTKQREEWLALPVEERLRIGRENAEKSKSHAQSMRYGK
jgi:hypothetical protein